MKMGDICVVRPDVPLFYNIYPGDVVKIKELNDIRSILDSIEPGVDHSDRAGEHGISLVELLLSAEKTGTFAEIDPDYLEVIHVAEGG